METSETEYEQNGERESTAANSFVVRFRNCKKQKFRLTGEQTAAARNDDTAKKGVSGLFQNFSGWPEDWNVSGPCHLSCTDIEILQSDWIRNFFTNSISNPYPKFKIMESDIQSKSETAHSAAH